MKVLEALAHARGSKGAQALERGTPERQIFERLTLDEDLRNKSALVIEEHLEVNAYKAEPRIVHRYLLNVQDSGLHAEWERLLSTSLRPGFGEGKPEGTVIVPDSLGQSLQSLVNCVELPAANVRYMGERQFDVTIPEFLHGRHDFDERAWPSYPPDYGQR